MRLKDNAAIVTGAGQGIGEAYAVPGGEAMFVHCDVSDEEATKTMAKTIADEWGRIDTLLNNAAIFYGIDLTGTAVWLAFDDSAMVTGQVTCCDGGMVMLG